MIPSRNNIYYAKTPLPFSAAQTSNPWLWLTPPRQINKSHIYLSLHATTMTLSQRSLSAFKKKVDLLIHGASLFDPPYLEDVTLPEIQTCEVLRRSPHPNVCLYRSVTVDKDASSAYSSTATTCLWKTWCIETTPSIFRNVSLILIMEYNIFITLDTCTATSSPITSLSTCARYRRDML